MFSFCFTQINFERRIVPGNQETERVSQFGDSTG